MLGTAILTLAPPVFAHQSKSVLSTVTWNTANSTIEVVHRMHANDVEMGLMQIAGDEAPVDIEIVRNQARLLVYVEKHFRLSDDLGEIALQPVGVEIKGEEIFAYQQALRMAPSQTMTVTNSLLRDAFEDQTNLVNIRMAKRTRTLIFAGRDEIKQAIELT